jgi:flavodoxin
MKRIAIICALLSLAAALGALTLASRAADPAKAPDVLIIHAAGTPFAGYDAYTPANVDAVSCPTSMVLNCQTVAERVAEALRARNLDVRVVEAAQITKRQQFLGPRAVVLASPTYFGTASWKMHKLIQEQLWQFFALGGKRIDGRLFATLVTAHAEAGATQCTGVLQGAIKSSGGTVGPGLVVLVSQKPDEVNARAAKFADELAAKLGESK